MEDIRQFQQRTKVSRMTMIWCGSTEVFHEAAEVHSSLKRFECGLQQNDQEISPSQIYAYAALKSGVPYANGAPHMTTDMPALLRAGARARPTAGGQRLQERANVHEDADCAGLEITAAGRERLVLDQHSGQPRRRGAGRPGLVPLEGSEQVLGAGIHFAEATLSRPVRERVSQSAHRVLPAAGRR